MICGSRVHCEKLMERARLLTARAWYRDHNILVGDAHGIDSIVVQQAESLKAKYCAYGINQRRGRNRARNYEPVTVDISLAFKEQYCQRDRALVDTADIVACCWNGYDKRSGTWRVFEYAVSQEKRTLLYTPNGLIEDYNGWSHATTSRANR